MPREITLVDANLGNLDSVERAIIQAGASVVTTSDPDRVAAARTLVFPGQGAFGASTNGLVNGALGAAIKVVIERGDPYLGICVGMQLLFDESEENGGNPGLGVLKGSVRRFPDGMTSFPGTRPLKIPHVGWNDVQPVGEHFYFSHSYYVDAAEPSDVTWTTRYGTIEFPAVVVRGNVYGCQFHPEKSQWAGLRFLRSFLLGGRA